MQVARRIDMYGTALLAAMTVNVFRLGFPKVRGAHITAAREFYGGHPKVLLHLLGLRNPDYELAL